MEPSEEKASCPRCGGPLAAGAAEGLCRRCLVEAALDPEPLPLEDEEALGQLGDYEILERIGQGGMGTIYRARQAGLNREVAVKLIPEGRLAGEADIARFRVEAMAAADLDHPNILPIYEVGEDEGQHFFSMPYIGDGTLEDRLGEFRGKSRKAVEVVEKVARAVHHAHQRGILHRDLKPANVLLRADREPLVSDFGLAKRLTGEGAALTQPGQMLGSPAYLAPEIASGASGASVASDLYSLGVMFYQLLVGRVPFRGKTQIDIIRQVISEEPPKPGVIEPSVPRDLETVCLKCLEKDPARRYGSVAELADDLKRWLDGEPVLASPAGPVRRAWKWMKRRPAAAGMIGISLVAIGALIAVLLISGGQVRRERDVAIEQERRAREGRYLSDMVAVFNALEDGNLAKARELVAVQIPKEGEADLRGTEWRLAWWRCQGDELRTIDAHGAAVTCLALDEERGWLLTGAAAEERVRVLKVKTGESVMELPRDFKVNLRLWERPEISQTVLQYGLEGARARIAPYLDFGPPIALTFFNDKRYLAVGTPKNFVKIVDLEKPQLVGWWEEIWARPVAVPGSPMVVVGVGQNPAGTVGKTMIYDSRKVTTGTVTHAKVKQLDPEATAQSGSGVVGVSADGSSIVTGGKGWLRLYNAQHRLRHEVAYYPTARSIAVGPGGQRVASAHFHRRDVHFWSTTAESAHQCVGHQGEINVVAFAPDGSCFASGGVDQSIRLWDGKTGSPLRVLKGHTGSVNALQWSADSRTLVSGAGDGTVKFWDPGGADDGSAWGENLLPLDLSPDGSEALCVAERGGRDRLVIRKVDGSGTVRTIAVDGVPLAAGFVGGGARVAALLAVQQGRSLRGDRLAQWDVATLGPVGDPLPFPRKDARAAWFSPESAVVGVYHGTGEYLQWWDLDSGARIRSAATNAYEEIEDPVFTPDRELIVTRNVNRRALVIYEQASGVERRSIPIGDAMRFALSPDGRVAAVGLQNNEIGLWDIATGEKVAALAGHLFPPNRLAWSPDGKHLVSAAGGGLGSVRLWHIPSRREIGVLHHGSAWHWLRFLPDGSAILGKRYKRAIDVWPIPKRSGIDARGATDWDAARAAGLSVSGSL